MTDTKVPKNPVNPNLETFRKQMAILNVTAYPEMLIYKTPSQKIAESCIPMALKLILKNSLPLEIIKPSLMGNTFIVKPIQNS